MSATIRVFVDGRGVDVAAGATALDAVRAADPALAAEISAGRRGVTDSRGLPVEPGIGLSAGSILRLVAVRPRAGKPAPESR